MLCCILRSIINLIVNDLVGLGMEIKVIGVVDVRVRYVVYFVLCEWIVEYVFVGEVMWCFW